ncbi:MAG: hypothetical protein HYZ48_03280 [Chlamydiales bacterium]|nr:hypothetical protein [Chlamydiales bacterium]
MPTWTVTFSREAKKQYKKLERSGSKKPSIVDAVDFLVLDLQEHGPHLPLWSHYGLLGKTVISVVICKIAARWNTASAGQSI